MTRYRRILGVLAALTILVLGVPHTAIGASPTLTQGAAQARREGAPKRYEGTLPNGATWVADVPKNWTGTLLLYSHGYTPGPANPPRNSPNPETAEALLARGYALAGSSYSRLGWALATAVDDQLATLRAVEQRAGRPKRVIAVGTSMGGLVTGRLAQLAGNRIDAALAGCGIMGGGIDLHNYQLDGLHALNQLLMPDRPVKLVRFDSFDEAVATIDTFTSAIRQAQTTPEGRARIALAAAYFHLPGWFTGLPKPAEDDYATQQVGQYHGLLASIFRFQTGRFDVEQSSGGNPSWNIGVNYRRLLAASENADQVRSLFRTAGLDLRADLARLTATADVAPDPRAVRWMTRTSTVSGSLQMPVLTIHTTNDSLVPVQHEEEYAEDVRRMGDRRLLRQAYVDRPGHCTFTPSELVAGVLTVERRVETGHWGRTASAHRLQALANSLGLGDAAFIRFRPGEFLGDRARLAPERGEDTALSARE